MSLQFGEAVFITCVSLMLLFSVVSNILVITVIIKDSRIRNITNICLGNLAISDILLAVFVLPQKMHDISHTNDYFEGAAFCSIVNFAPLFCIMVSIYTMVTISFERRRAIVLSADHNSLKIIKFVLPLIWLGSFVLTVPTLAEYAKFEHFNPRENKTEWRCGTVRSKEYSLANVFMLILLAYLIPLVMVINNYVVTVRFIWQNCRNVAMTNQRKLIARNRMKIIKMMIIVTALFAVSWAPYFTLLAIGKISGLDGTEKSDSSINLMRITLAAFSTAYNVFFYIIYNKNFRDGFKAICFGVIPRNRITPLATVQIAWVRTQ